MRYLKPGLSPTALLALAALVTLPAAVPARAGYTYNGKPMDCAQNKSLCTEVYASETVFGHYVGHDEPAVLFYSNTPGSGNHTQWQVLLPSDPSPVVTDPTPNDKSWNFELHPAFWLGMAMCDTQSYPEVRPDCPADSDANITALANHPGTAFTELQFYPPGYVAWPAGTSCSATQWCAALNIDSLSLDPIHGNALNAICQSVTGVEYVNFAFVTKDGTTAGHGPAGPLTSSVAKFTPNPATDLFMNSGDTIRTTMFDTADGLKVVIDDLTTGVSGSMTASPANGFGQMRFAPPPDSGDPRAGTDCTQLPYAFHPMYSTSSPLTRVPWSAHSYNIAFSDEIGHFDYCTGALDQSDSFTPCLPNTGSEGVTGDHKNAEGLASTAFPLADDDFCFTPGRSSLVQVQGCLAANLGFDGVSYKHLWPNGDPNHAGPLFFSSPLTGGGQDFDSNYQAAALEADLPAVERDTYQHCDVFNGDRCTPLPLTDDGSIADFYPFYSIGTLGDNSSTPGDSGVCWWTLGESIPGFTRDAFGGSSQQYGPLYPQTYLISGGGGNTDIRYNDFHQDLQGNPCPARVP
jgi:hypothetical protein